MIGNVIGIKDVFMYDFRVSLCTLLPFVIALSGCDDNSQINSRIDELTKFVEAQKTRVEKMETEHSAIRSSVETSITRSGQETESLKNELHIFQEKWVEFERSYSPDVRSQLDNNLKNANANSMAIQEIKSLADELLKSIAAIETQSNQFRELTKKHADQSAEFDKIGDLTQSLETIQTQIKNLESEVSKAVRDASSAESMARSAFSKASRR